MCVYGDVPKLRATRIPTTIHANVYTYSLARCHRYTCTHKDKYLWYAKRYKAFFFILFLIKTNLNQTKHATTSFFSFSAMQYALFTAISCFQQFLLDYWILSKKKKKRNTVKNNIYIKSSRIDIFSLVIVLYFRAIFGSPLSTDGYIWKLWFYVNISYFFVGGYVIACNGYVLVQFQHWLVRIPVHHHNMRSLYGNCIWKLALNSRMLRIFPFRIHLWHNG